MQPIIFVPSGRMCRSRQPKRLQRRARRTTTSRCDSDLARLGALLETLPQREQELVALKYGAEATNRAIAELTGLSESNVGTILHRVVQALRRDW